MDPAKITTGTAANDLNLAQFLRNRYLITLYYKPESQKDLCRKIAHSPFCGRWRMDGRLATISLSVPCLQAVDKVQSWSLPCLQTVDKVQSWIVPCLQTVDKVQSWSVPCPQTVDTEQSWSIPCLQAVEKVRSWTVPCPQTVDSIYSL